MKKILSLLLTLSILLGAAPTILYAEDVPSVDTEIDTPSIYTQIDEVLENIAADYCNLDAHDWDVIIGMGAYALYAPDSQSTLSEEAKNEYINSTIGAIDTENPAESPAFKAILSLPAIGKDPDLLYPVNSNDSFSAVDVLNSASNYISTWVTPYTLAAYNQGDYSNPERESELVTALLELQLSDGSWDEYGTIDTTANAITALSYYQDDPDVAEAIEAALDYLSAQQSSTGDFAENANSTAMVMIALAALNKLDDDRFIKDGSTVADGLLTYLSEGNSGFDSMYSQPDSYATKQAFMALVAMMQTVKTGEAYNIYNFSNNELEPARATSSGTVSLPDEPSGDEITVRVTIKADTGYWLKRYRTTLSGDNATVYHAFKKACDDNDILYDGVESGYISSITKDGDTLSEFDGGTNSGWLYKVNDELPNIGFTEYKISDGDEIVWYYTEDWAKDPSAKYYDDYIPPVEEESDATVEEEVEATQESTGEDLEEIPTEEVIPVQAEINFDDIDESDWFFEDAKKVAELGLLSGISENIFAPNEDMTRSMLAAVLYRYDGEKGYNSSATFDDFSDNEWYSDAVSWATENNIIAGYGNGLFGVADKITREQLVTILYRYGGEKTAFDLSSFDDYSDIKTWATEAMQWAVKSKIILGDSQNRLSPNAFATRAEAAAILIRYINTLTNENDLKDVLADVVNVVYANVPEPSVASIGGEWTVFGLARADTGIASDYFDIYLANLEQKLNDNQGILHSRKYTEYSRAVIALTAIGENPENVAGYNLLTPLTDYDSTIGQGINGAIFALIALDSDSYLPETEVRTKYVTYISDNQLSDGGFSMSGSISDVDTTAMAIIALSNYKDDEKVSAAIDNALLYLSSVQLESGGFESSDTENCESSAQVLTALCTLGIDITDPRFVKGENTVLDSLMKYYSQGNGFKHLLSDETPNQMATEQALLALAALDRLSDGKDSIYKIGDF